MRRLVAFTKLEHSPLVLNCRVVGWPSLVDKLMFFCRCHQRVGLLPELESTPRGAAPGFPLPQVVVGASSAEHEPPLIDVVRR